MKFFLCVLGLVMIVEGLPYFAFLEKMKQWIAKALELSPGSMRGLGLALMLAGLLLVALGRMG